jgi:hypothetical protein
MVHADRFRARDQETQSACHRCGWSGSVYKVGHRDRRLLGTGRTYGRLCRDCAESLYRSRTTGQGAAAAKRAPLRALRDRDVA